MPSGNFVIFLTVFPIITSLLATKPTEGRKLLSSLFSVADATLKVLECPQQTDFLSMVPCRRAVS